MAEPAIDPTPEVLYTPLVDEDGLPLEGGPMTEEQAWVGLLLKLSLTRYAAAEGLDWQVHFDSGLGYLDAAGKPQRLFPDLFVVEGLAPLPSPFNTWVFERVPDLALELASETSVRRDTGEKLEIYRGLRVPEYFVFDVGLSRIPGLLAGYRLDAQGEYQPIPREQRGKALTRLRSHVLGLDLGVVRAKEVLGGYGLRAFLPGADDPLPTPEEAELRAQQAELRAQQAELRAQQAELRAQQAELRARDETIARLEGELRRLRGEE